MRATAADREEGRAASSAPLPPLPPVARLVLQVLAEAGPVSASALRMRVSAARAAPTPPMSIYRALARLQASGLAVQSIASKRYCFRATAVAEPALLLVCRRCGAVDQRAAPECAEDARRLASSRRFRPSKVHLEIVGLCPACHSPAQDRPGPARGGG